MTFALTRSRCARDLKTIYENTTVSPDLPWRFVRERNSDLDLEIVAGALLVFERALFPPDFSRLLGHAAVSLQIFLWDGQHISIDVLHIYVPFFVSSGPLRDSYLLASPSEAVTTDSSLALLISRTSCPEIDMLGSYSFGSPLISLTGRTSTVPIRAPGIRAPIPIALLSSLASIRK